MERRKFLAGAVAAGAVGMEARRSVNHAATPSSNTTIAMRIGFSLATGELTGQFIGRCDLLSFSRISTRPARYLR